MNPKSNPSPKPTQDEVTRVIEAHPGEFEKPGVLSVRAGFLFEHGWITGDPAIVVTVAGVDAAARPKGLPREVGGVPVEVRAGSPAKVQRILDPGAYLAAGRLAPDSGAVPEFPSEFVFTGSEPGLPGALRSPSARPSPASLSPLAALPALTELPSVAAAAAKPQLPYTPPTGVSLSPVAGELTVELCATPDAAWPVLKSFLDQTAGTLTVGMYDFTSAHVLSEVETALAAKKLNLTLDHPALDPTADQSDEQTVAALHSSLTTGLDQAWALERMDPLAAAWIFPTAYHIKVAVRDSASVWVSSGNWNNSNQPDIDPVNDPGDSTAARSADRDWHVVVSDPALSQTLEAFLLNDLKVAGAHDVTASSAATTPGAAATPGDAATPGAAAAPDDAAVGWPVSSALTAPRATTPPFAQFFPAKTITGQMTITPLLTPDPGVYVDAVTALVSSAQRTLHLQFQYIELPKTAGSTSAAFASLVDAVIARQKAGVEVQIIMSEYETAGYLEQLQAAGLDVVNSVKIQNNVHNKGIVVDGSSVLVSSQNWSTDGALYNRDAGVVIANSDVAAYFDQLFAHDWENLAVQKAAND